MKRIICAVLAMVLLLGAVPVGARAATEDILYFEDGSYIVISVNELETRASKTKTGSKSYTFYGENGTNAWTAVLYGTFTYSGSSAECTNASCSVTVNNSNWRTASKSAYKSGNAAYGDVTMEERLLGVTVQRYPISMTLTCDANGNLS